MIIVLTEEVALNTSELPDEMRTWKRYRVNYQPNGPEEVLYLPAHIPARSVQNILTGIIQTAPHPHRSPLFVGTSGLIV